MAADPVRGTERTVSVSASGNVSAEPDVAVISAGVVSEAETAREALSRNNTQMGKLVDGLKTLGIAAKDIQTTGVSIEPRYTAAQPGRPPTISGYRVANQVRITARDIKRFGEVLDQAVSLGANQMGGISFEVSESERLKDEARRTAMANARRRAELYAAAAGATLGPVLQISETVAGPPVRPFAAPRAMAADSVPVEPGSQRLEVTVHVTWALN